MPTRSVTLAHGSTGDDSLRTQSMVQDLFKDQHHNRRLGIPNPCNQLRFLTIISQPPKH